MDDAALTATVDACRTLIAHRFPDDQDPVERGAAAMLLPDYWMTAFPDEVDPAWRG